MNPELATGVTMDLALLMPLTYFLAIRRTKVPNITVVPIFILSVLLVNHLLPTAYRGASSWILDYVLPVLELVIITFIFIKVRAFVKVFPKQDTERDFYLLIRQASKAVLEQPRVANVFATEIAMIYYALFSWKKADSSGFTHYKKNGMLALLWAVILIVLVETFALHLFLVQWNAVVAWIVFGLSLYTCLQIFAHIKALKQRKTQVKDGQLWLKYGLFGDTVIPLDQIEQVEWTRKRIHPLDKKVVQQLSLLGELESHNLILHLNTPITIHKAYGIQKRATKLMLNVDDKEIFEATISQPETNP